MEQVLEERNRLKDQADHFAHEIDLLKEQLVQTTAVIKKHNWNATPVDSENEILDEKHVEKTEKPIIEKVEDKEIKTDQIQENLLVKDENKVENEDKIDVPKPESIKSFSENDTLSKLIKISDLNFDSESIPFDDTLSPDELDIIQDIRCKINLYIEQKVQEMKKVHNLELKILEDQLESEKNEHVLEAAKLRELLSTVKSGSADVDVLRNELNEKHSKEMEELRTYFEERCAEIEKQ